MPLHLAEGWSTDGRFTNRMRLLTAHDHPHTLDKAVDNLENLGRCRTSLVFRESVKPFQDQIDIVLSEDFLHEYN